MNGDGELELFEWLELAAIVFLGKDDTEVPMEMFKHLAHDATGKITQASLFSSASRLLARIGKTDFTEADAGSMLSALDSTGELGAEGFLDACKGLGFYKPES